MDSYIYKRRYIQMIDFIFIPGFLDLPESKKDSCRDFIQFILSSQFDDDRNVDIKHIKKYADSVEVTFLRNNEEYTFCNITPSFFFHI